MAALVGSSLEEELTCSICLCLFSSPVTVPCGHNFCSTCLELSWAGLSENLSCPQCRAPFASRPQLQKNTVLCRVVEQLQGSAGAAAQEEKEEERGEEEDEEQGEAPVWCDSCMQAPAVQTCLTCTASFCPEHLRPHRDSPAFRDHQLRPPLRHLHRRKCPQHSKIFEFFCSQHASSICSLCLLGHKQCHISPLQDARASAESALKKKLVELHNQGERAARAMNTVKTSQSQASETASRKKELIRNEFSEIKALIEEKENQTLKVIADEEKRVCNRYDCIYNVLRSKKNEIQSLRDQIETALTEADDVLFLKRAATLQQTSIKEAFVPVNEMDQNLIHSAFQSTVNLKEIVRLSVAQFKEKCAEAKVTLVKTNPPSAAFPSKPGGKKPPEAHHPHKEKTHHQTQAASPAAANPKEKKKTTKAAPTTGPQNAATAAATKELIESFLKKSREELLQYAANVTLDYNTAHNKVLLSERYTRMSVSDTPMNYNPHPQRFTDCFQVLGFQYFKRGIHYWEVELQQNNFCGIGICYGSMARQGPESRLGRNSSSWCIEWFNSKISSWHNDVEKCLPCVKATKIGVLLHCEGGFVIFMAVGEKHNLIYKFKTHFTEALYPAFWLFSSGTALSLCQLNQ